jgi:hypothetical protein
MDIYSRSNRACLHATSVSPGRDGRFYTAAKVSELRNDLEVLTLVLNWVDGFLARPHSQLGRSGKVCPFVPDALIRGALQLTVLRLEDDRRNNLAEIERIVLGLLDRFMEGEGPDTNTNMYRSLIMIFPDVSAEDAPFLIDGTQRKLKAEFVRHGLMLGEFHPLSNQPGLRNPEFRPLRSPVPLMAIRHMVESDIDFLNRSDDPPSQRLQFLTAYLNSIGSALSPANRMKATAGLRKAEDESSSSGSSLTAESLP